MASNCPENGAHSKGRRRGQNWLEGLPKGTRAFRFESNTVEFELVPSTTSRLNFDINEAMRLPPEKRQAWIEKNLKASKERVRRMDKWEKRYLKDLEKRMEKMDKILKKTIKAP
ncbi:MAG: hypothetical protein HZB91_00195 [Elusimicrobia bacterium]|nr:hypothetical protein [Elusimicrobiota bacterium]